jgi:hypothetical protein
MNPRLAALLFGASLLMLAGCLTPFRAPAGAPPLALTAVDSPVVHVEKAWLAQGERGLIVRGYVLRHPGATPTDRTHLHATLQDDAGNRLRDIVGFFTPRSIPASSRQPGAASYEIALAPVPTGATRLVIRAHEGADACLP